MALRYIEVKQMLLEEIPQMPPNTRLPSRTELSEKYLAARATVDKAIRALTEQGYLYSVPGSGTYVSGGNHPSSKISASVYNIGVLLPSVLSDVYPGILRGIEDVMQSHGINVVICNTDNDPVKQNAYIKRLIYSKVNGIIVIPSVNSTPKAALEMENMLEGVAFPVVLCNNLIDHTNYPIVYSNNFYGGYLATKHLLERGYQRVAFLSNIRYRACMDRLQGYLAALSEAGMAIIPAHISIPNDQNVHVSGYQSTQMLLSQGSVDAIFCFNDRIAFDAMMAIADAGFQVSADVGVIGYDNTANCEYLPRKLTSVSYKTYEIGRKAAQIIVDRLDNAETAVDYYTICNPEVIVRESCLGPGK